MMAWLVALWLIIVRTKIPPRAYPTLSRLVSQLMIDQGYDEVRRLITPQLPAIKKASESDLVLGRLHKWIHQLNPRIWTHETLLDKLDRIEGQLQKSKPRWLQYTYNILHISVSKLAYLIPSQDRARDAANDMMRTIYRSPGHVEFLAKYRPTFGTILLSYDFWERRDFSDRYLTVLISDPGGPLYQEIQHNQNTTSTGYAIPKENVLLQFLFGDARNAEKLAA